jgi:hypothetical protein
MLLASRLSETHPLEVQTLSAEPAGTGGRVAAGPPAPGPPPQPQMHDAASAATPSATTQTRLTTAKPPRSPRSLTELRGSVPLPGEAGPIPPGICKGICEPALLIVSDG